MEQKEIRKERIPLKQRPPEERIKKVIKSAIAARKTPQQAPEKWVPTICWGCTEGPCHIRVQVIDGIAVNIKGNVDGPGFESFSKNQGRLCPKALSLIQKLYNPFRRLECETQS